MPPKQKVLIVPRQKDTLPPWQIKKKKWLLVTVEFFVFPCTFPKMKKIYRKQKEWKVPCLQKSEVVKGQKKKISMRESLISTCILYGTSREFAEAFRRRTVSGYLAKFNPVPKRQTIAFSKKPLPSFKKRCHKSLARVSKTTPLCLGPL